MKVNYFQKMDVNVFPTREIMGETAGKDVEKQIIQLLKEKETIRMIFAAAPSQNEMLAYLAASDKIEWNRITAFHMDEYIGLDWNDSRSFSTYLNEHLFEKVNLKEVHLINGKAPEKEEVERYSALISEAPIDIVCLGIGENGHIAFNDPPVADFNDKKILKLVELDETCRIQQVNEECFDTLDDVPREAFTLTIPVLMNADFLFCDVPGSSKSEAIYNALNGPVSTKCPASILQNHSNCKFYFDEDSYSYTSNELKKLA
ncbi:MAG TPA: glucosamine-6-phosphate deaminase [Draconibacterium sp.]|nr:glucosamine-6-phosphate deaminase [Draconibacterium sp.]